MLPTLYCPLCHEEDDFAFDTLTGLCFCACGNVIFLADKEREQIQIFTQAQEREAEK